ncbi:hypothetical protein FQR65_LT07671 [Abscondita terminalis]|nr:hypothetical protein FQR65_LT07671 [Abscondita terminalis]
MEIKSLPQDVRDILRSGENVSSISQCVMELVLNSLDAKATAIAIRINLLTLRIQVVDNGVGVTESNMNVIGVRYMTSKCHSLFDLKKLRGYGFRGEALASICEMAKKVELTSRAEGTEYTYSKIYENGKWSALEVLKTRPGTGTTVTVTEFMYKLPVRKNRISKNLDLDETKRRIEELAIINCNVSFSLRNDSTGRIVLQSKQIQNVAEALINFYPKIMIGELCQVKVSKGKISVNGLIYKLSSTNSKLQFIFLNKRPINCVKIQKFINNLLSKTVSKGEHPVYCLNVRCSYSNVDILMSPSKTKVEFKNWELVRKCLEKAIKVVVQDQKTEMEKPVALEKAPSYKSQFGLSLISGAVQGNPVKRKVKSNSVLKNTATNVEHSIWNFAENNGSNEVNVSKDNKIECLTNYTLTTNNLENQAKGKELLMNMFLKSTVAYPKKRSHTDNVLGKSTKTKFPNTTMTMTIVSKKTILRNPHMDGCQKQNMVSKCVQTTMVQHRTGLVDFESNIINPNFTFSKYFANFNKENFSFFGNFGKKNFVSRPEYFFREIPAQTSFNFLKDCFIFDGKRRNVFNFFPLYQNPFLNFRRPLNDNNRRAILPKKRKCTRTKLFDTTCSPYFAKNLCRKPFTRLPNPQIILQSDAHYCEPNAKRIRLNENITKREDHHKSKFKSHIVKVPEVIHSNIYPKQCTTLYNNQKTAVFPPAEKPKYLQENQYQTFNFNLIPNVQRKNYFSNNTLIQRANTEFPSYQKPIEHFENLNSEPLFEDTPTSNKKNVLITDASISVRFLSNYTKYPASSVKIDQNRKVLSNKHSNDVFDQPNDIEGQNQLQITPFQFPNMEIATEKSFSNGHDLYKSNDNQCGLNTPSFLFLNNSIYNDHHDKRPPKQSHQNLFPNFSKKQVFPEEVTIDSKIIQHKQKPKNRLSLKKHVSCPMPKPNLFEISKPFSSFSEVTSIHDYDKFKPDLCSTRINAIDLCDNAKPNFSIPVLDTTTKTPEWLQKQDYLGNKFYLNVRTGIESFRGESPDTFDHVFSIAKRIDFVPKGLSPIMVETKKIDVSMSPQSKKALHEVLIESYKSELETIKWSNLIDNDTDIKVFFQKLYEEKTKLFENCIPNISVNTLPKFVVKQFNNNQAQSYPKDFLINLDIIGQWDRKFVAAFCKTKQILFLFDQHAVSERIRLEKLLKEYKDGEKFKSSRCDVRIFKAFSESELSLLAEFKIVFDNLGIRYSVRDNALYISHIPTCLYSKPHNNGFEQIKNLVISVICEQLQILKMTRGVGTKVPEVLQNIVNSQACRGAIKFGDPLSENDCAELIKELHKCRLPFQCAHGRPSVVPLLNLEKRFLLERSKPNLRNLKQC